ncbi:hypothetical protein [Pseudomonas sp. MYb193]|uniref:hypothetical protein n=1 Tax=Pseudomonas sp. MYb193 TaxID=1827300 RepID=UPI000CF61FB9|nr:hypothetical protein [Pseudomonas sp. MYb193]AVJ22699.1 hypothetical protein CLM72_13525 [Pseudomonas sp. MYb193]
MTGKTIKETGTPLEDYDLGPVLISGITPPVEGDTESDGALGARHVEHDLEVLLLGFPDQVLDTEIYLIWNNPHAPVDYLIIQPENQGNRFFSLMVDKEQILPEWAEVYCLIRRPSGNTSKTKPLRLRVKRNRPGDPDQHSESGHRGLVFYLPPDLEAGSHVDMARAERGVTLEIQPWEYMAEWDTCRIAWGSKIVEKVVAASEVGREFEMTISLEDILENPHYVNMPVAMQIRDVAGNYPADPNSASNWSEKKRVEVNLGLLRPRPPFLEQAGEDVNLDELGAADQTVQVFVDNNFFEKGDTIAFEWEGRDVQNVPFFHSEERSVVLTNVIEEFDIPNEWVRAVAMGTVIMYYSLYKHRDDKWLPSRKVRVTVTGNVPEWPAPRIVEAPGGELEPTSIATMKFNVQDGWTTATKLRIVWAAHSVNFTEEFYLDPFPVDRVISFTLANDQVRPFNTLPVEVYYERIDLKPERQSQRLQLQVGEPARTLPLAQIEELSGNYLDPNSIGAHVLVILPLTDSFENDFIQINWDGDITSTAEETTVGKDQEGGALSIPFERRFVDENQNQSVRIRYSLSRKDVPKRFSQILTIYIHAKFDHITNFHQGNLNGWSYGNAVSDPQDRAFKNYGSYTTFYNLTYYNNRKSGVVFSQVFNNLIPGQQYEFSLKARRHSVLTAVPAFSLGASGHPEAPITLITDTVNFQQIIRTFTPATSTLTLIINSHEDRSPGNDYEFSEIRFRLI